MSDTHKKIDNSVKFKTGEDNPMFGKTGKDHPMFGKPRASGAGSAPQKIEVFGASPTKN